MTPESRKTGRLFVLSAPSGAGKSTVKNLVLRRLPDLAYSISYTTRQPRPGEADGRDYHFISPETFKAMIERGDFLEWAEVFGRHSYGTGRPWIEEKLAAGRDVLADLDVAGAASVKKLKPESVLIFMVPPTAGELIRRLAGRHTESEEEIRRRLAASRAEVGRRSIFDYLLINDEADRAAAELAEIIRSGQGRSMAGTEDFWAGFFDDQAG
jgi:guanylate kinase